MGVVLPGWADEVLDIIGVSWPNVDEDDYREMADAMRGFANDIDEGAGEAHEAVQGLVSSAGGSLAVEALNAHWGKINGTHLRNLAECGRMAATAMDGVAVLIEGAKLGALVQLGILAAEVIAAQAAAPFTLGLSEVGALAATQATRMIVKRLFKEVCRQVAEQVISIALTPVEEALGAMVGDLVVQLGANALGVQDGVDVGRAARAGEDGFRQGVHDAKKSAKSAAANPMELLSAGGRSGGGATGATGGSGAGGSGGFRFDPDEHDRVVTGLEAAGGTFRNKAGGKIGRVKHHHGRTRGKDAIADAANAMLDKVIEGVEDGLVKTAKHLDDNMTRGVKQMAKNHHDNDQKLASHFSGLGKEGKKEPKAPRPGGNGNGGENSGGRKGGSGADHGRDPWWHGHSADEMRHHRLDPVDVSGLDHKTQLQTLDEQSEKLANEARKASANNSTPGKDYRRDGCAGSFLHNGEITAHTSSVRRKVSQTQKEIDSGAPAPTVQEHPKAHPALQQLLDDIEGRQAAEGKKAGAGHGNCAEVALVSDRLHQMDPAGTTIRNPEDARRALEGGVMHTRQIGEMREKDPVTGKKVTTLSHGDFKKPCRSCEHMLPALGISVHE
ncbi:YwqJ-related putative deaminase [Streptomyces angustmyceticus]|uniref:YwqJ-related putative deaminase n=1 Tax=Streptomyces angustmyceticus TaxID=285578 RepID=UPI0021AE7917|nr:YwqJ-related putative deaminase [Streptomyces angustmyceticus]